jgi:predicted aspartyl protease
MGRIISSVKIDNVSDSTKSLRCDALVDTGASYMTLPTAWRDRLGDLEEVETVKAVTATQETARAVICGPVRIQVEGFRPIYTELCFVDMKSEDGTYQPLIGYLVLEQCQAAVDMLGHRLVHVAQVDLR